MKYLVTPQQALTEVNCFINVCGIDVYQCNHCTSLCAADCKTLCGGYCVALCGGQLCTPVRSDPMFTN